MLAGGANAVTTRTCRLATLLTGWVLRFTVWVYHWLLVWLTVYVATSVKLVPPSVEY